MSDAHVIPQAVGGKLAVKNLCSGCNSKLGYTAEKGLKSDPRIRLAIEELQAKIPNLADKMRAGQEFVARDEEVVIRATPRSEGFKILDSPQEGGSRIKDRARAWKEIETTLRRHFGATDEQVEAARALHDAAAEGELVELAPGLAIKKSSVPDFGLPFTEPLVEDLCLLSVAYLFLSVLVQGAIYDEAFQPIRSALQGGDADGARSVESFLANRPHEPWHGLAIDQAVPHFVIQVRLFGQHAWKVSLPCIACQAELAARSYRLDLATGEEAFVE